MKAARVARVGACAGVCASVVLGACGARPAPSVARGPSLSPTRYEIAIDPSLERLTETLCSEGPWTDRVVSIHEEARARLVTASIVRGGVERPLRVEGTDGPLAITTAGLAPSECVRLVLDVARAGGGMDGCLGRAGVVTCATSAWLVAAEPWRTSSRHRVTFTLPEGVAVSPIFGEDEGGTFLDERAFRYVGYVSFGDLVQHEITVPGGCAHVVAPARSEVASSPHLVPWVERASRASAALTGLSTARDVTISVLPVPMGSAAEPVLFGMAGRGTRPSVIALVAEPAVPTLETDWTLVHELVHLSVPYVPVEDAWLSEGIATYYQEILRARAGMQSAEEAWRALDRGVSRGAAEPARDTLREASRGMRESRAFTRVYWAGAAIVWMLDVVSRASGRESLDARIARLEARRDETMSADALIAALDDEDGTLRALVDRWLDEEEFPDLGDVYEALSLSHDANGELVLSLRNSLRESIVNDGRSAASNGRCSRVVLTSPACGSCSNL
ncbi:MAG: hypothetical protein K1X94_23535 [Sandaracinaceae bacterium]|nr:hypothetical protein [Sandaracinaceae bacterium]